MLRKIASAFCAVLIGAAPAMAQYINYPITPINTPITTPQEAANSAISVVNKYLTVGIPTGGVGLAGKLGPATVQTYGSPSIVTQSIFVGPNAGSAFPSTGSDLYSSTAFGSFALQNYTTLGGETTCVGAETCQFLSTGSLTTAIGMHAAGFEQTEIGDVAVGTDALRDTLGVAGYNTAIGESAMAHGIPSNPTTAIGALAMQGNSASILLSGTITAGNTFAISITNGGSYNLTGLPFNYTHTVAGGDTLLSILQDVCSKVSIANIQGPSYALACAAASAPDGVAYIWFSFPGTTTNGWTLGITGASAQGSGGSNTLTVTNQAGFAANQNVSIGSSALQANAATSLYDSTAIGYNAGNNARTAQYSTFIGGSAGTNVTTGGSETFVGALAGANVTTAGDDTLLGFWAGYGLNGPNGSNTVLGARSMYAATTAGSNTVVGHSIVNSTVYTGSGGVYIGSGNRAIEPISASATGEINIESVYRNYSSSPAITSAQALGTTPAIVANGSHIFKATVGASPTGTTETLTFSTAANGWVCSASDITTSTNTAKQTGSTATTAVMTWSGTLTAADVILHTCDSY